MKLLVAIVLVVFSSVVSAANEFSLRISEESLSFMFDPQASETNSFQFAYVHNDDNNSDLLNAGFFANGSRESFDGRLGGKAYYADLDNDSGYGFALGGEVYIPLGAELKLNAGAYYGPSSLAFSDIDGYEEYFIKVNYQVFDNARVGLGLVSLKLEPENNQKVEVDNGVFIEMNLSF